MQFTGFEISVKPARKFTKAIAEFPDVLSWFGLLDLLQPRTIQADHQINEGGEGQAYMLETLCMPSSSAATTAGESLWAIEKCRHFILRCYTSQLTIRRSKPLVKIFGLLEHTITFLYYLTIIH